MRRRRLMCVLVVSLLVAASGCQQARLGARCRTTDRGGDGKIVMRCVQGRWQRSMTYGQAATFVAAMLQPPAPEPGRVVLERSGNMPGRAGIIETGLFEVTGPWKVTATIAGDTRLCMADLYVDAPNGASRIGPAIRQGATIIPTASFTITGTFQVRVLYVCPNAGQATWTLRIRQLD